MISDCTELIPPIISVNLHKFSPFQRITHFLVLAKDDVTDRFHVLMKIFLNHNSYNVVHPGNFFESR